MEVSKKTEYVFFDYFTFTIRLENVDDVFPLLGVSPSMFEVKEKAPNHYEKALDFQRIFIIKFAEMNEESKKKYKVTHLKKCFEINVTLTGTAVREYSTLSSFQSCFLMLYELWKSDLLLAPINFTRVDFTKDDKEGLLDIDKIEKKLEKGEVVTRLKHSVISSQFDKDKGRYLGKTLYLGSKSSNSEFFIRIYNKSAEVYGKKEVSKRILDEHNIRVEMVFKKSNQANSLMEKVFLAHKLGEPIGSVYTGVLVRRMNILKNGKTVSKKDEENRKNMDNGYKEFIENAEKVKLGKEEKITTIDQKIEYVKSHARTLAMIYQAIGYDEFQEMIGDAIVAGTDKLTILDLSEIQEYKKKNTFIGSESAEEEIED